MKTAYICLNAECDNFYRVVNGHPADCPLCEMPLVLESELPTY